MTLNEKIEKANKYERVANSLDDLAKEVNDAEEIGKTRLAELFHECRTSKKRVWKRATAFINIEDGRAKIDSVLKIREGRWSPETLRAYDETLSISISPFMDTDTFRRLARKRLHDKSRMKRQRAAEIREQVETERRLRRERENKT